MAHQKVAVRRTFYLVPAGLIVLVLIVAVLSSISESRSLSDPAFLRIVYMVLALAVILFTFGFLGDSEALIRSDSSHGLEWQIGGSAAGVLILYVVLSWGLTPYRSLTVHLLKENGTFLGSGDGPVDVVVASEVKRSITTTDGEAIFAYLPRSEDWGLHISGSGWTLKELSPKGCLLDQDNISHSYKCTTVRASVAQIPLCLTDLSLVVGEATPIKTNLGKLLQDFKDDMQGQANRFAIQIHYSDAFLKQKLNQLPFTIQRKGGNELKACDILDDIADRFSLAYQNHPIRVYASCTVVFVQTASEARPAGDMCSK
jgi:hypothetical protein